MVSYVILISKRLVVSSGGKKDFQGKLKNKHSRQLSFVLGNFPMVFYIRIDQKEAAWFKYCLLSNAFICHFLFQMLRHLLYSRESPKWRNLCKDLGEKNFPFSPRISAKTLPSNHTIKCKYLVTIYSSRYCLGCLLLSGLLSRS